MIAQDPYQAVEIPASEDDDKDKEFESETEEEDLEPELTTEEKLQILQDEREKIEKDCYIRRSPPRHAYHIW